MISFKKPTVTCNLKATKNNEKKQYFLQYTRRRKEAKNIPHKYCITFLLNIFQFYFFFSK